MRFTFAPFWFRQSPDGYLHAPDAPAGGTVQPPASDAPASAPSSSPAPASDPAAPAQPAGQTPPASATTRPADDWVAPDRKTYEGLENSRRALAARTKELDRDLKAEKARVAALAGVTPQRPEDAKREEIAAAFYEMFPQMRMFQNPQVMDKLAGLLERGDELSQASDHIWDRLTQRTEDRIVDAYAEELNLQTKDVDPDMRRALMTMFTSMVMADPDANRSRYEREDPKLVEDFVGKLKKGFFEPASRVAASRVVRGLPRVPSSGPSRPVVSAPPTIDFSSREATEDAAVNYLKERGLLQGSGEAV